MEIILIAAMAKNRVIGRNNTIPWDIPGEQARFKKITMGHPLIMGRKTWLSLGRPLPGRQNIVLTTNTDFSATGADVVHTLVEALAACKNGEKVFIIGGEQLFRSVLPLADTLILTILDREVQGDTFFPEFSSPPFTLNNSERVQQDDAYTIMTYTRTEQETL
ncbi:MAG: dihydrofolate reductase [Desulfobulbus sp.]|nr:MAG: dihydrofolate reductase [Desulfobulbus sp.]RUM37954.1 MAG: dihydrofolate reductase [Desulfobulbus sp.]RUM38084.1 MAG: dihydrofolate reductase [Desulfobulbus sp.]